MDEQDTTYLERALDLAERGRGCTNPNPIVGAVIVRGDSVMGEGWHVGAGRDHAEVAAIRDALVRAGRAAESMRSSLDMQASREVCAGATMYVSLEPCCTQGRTPPCTTALLGSGFDRLVVAALDPSPMVNGKGIELLRKAGVTVDVAEGLISHRAKRQNNGLRKRVTAGLPFVEYKYAITLDGRVATDSGDSRWISGPESRALVHKWRSWADAVVVGAGTAGADDPTLTARDAQCERQPLRVVVGRAGSLKPDSNLLRTITQGPVMVVCGDDIDPERSDLLQGLGVQIVMVPVHRDGGLDPLEVCRALAAREVQTLLLEGGPRLAGAWWRAGVVDKISAFVCPKLASGSMNAGSLVGPGTGLMREALGLREVEVTQTGADVLISGYTGGPF